MMLILKHVATAVLVIFSTFAYSQKSVISNSLYNSTTIPDSLKENANSVVRFYSKEIVVKSAGKAIVKRHLIQTILNEKDENEASSYIHYDRKFSEIIQAEMRVYDSMGTLIKRYKKNDFYDRSAVDGISIITDSRFIIAAHAIVSYPITIESTSEVTFSSFLDLPDWQIQNEEVAIQQSICKISVKPEVGLNYQLKNFSVLPIKSKEGEYDTYRWEVQNLKAVKPEVDSQSWSFLPRISFATNAINYDNIPGDMSTWQGLGAWQQTLNKNTADLPAKRIDEIKQMVADISSDKEKAKFLYNYMQKTTRYVSIQLGIGGLKPFPADFVDQKKYGDCKALSNYMQTLLKCVGIPSYYAIVNAGANAEPARPEFVNFPFNHVILCIPFKNDTTWLECTSSTKPFGQLGSFTENRKALLITENGGKLINTPKSSANNNVFETENVVTIATDGSATANMRIKSSGEYRDMLIGISEDKTDNQKKYFIQYLNLKQPDVIQVKHLNDTNGIKEVKLELIYGKLNDLASGGKYFYRPQLFDIWKYTVPVSKNRKTDYYFEHPMIKKAHTTYVFPSTIEVESLPPDVTYTFGYGKYTLSYKYDKVKNEVKSETLFEVTNHLIPAAQYTDMQKFMDSVSVSMAKKLIVKQKVEKLDNNQG